MNVFWFLILKMKLCFIYVPLTKYVGKEFLVQHSREAKKQLCLKNVLIEFEEHSYETKSNYLLSIFYLPNP